MMTWYGSQPPAQPSPVQCSNRAVAVNSRIVVQDIVLIVVVILKSILVPQPGFAASASPQQDYNRPRDYGSKNEAN